ncbi:ferritin [candidate division KSB3 bacterium]|uniref:Ferritin n=1 Tax=candidate division KSB3 bacterium TaxID=2044937 RepID=A0A2G6KK04_9BACT|nr:MAG: ferritin [candidate division KSB3 bacterium]
MLSPKMEAALNKQINAEFYSSYLYLSMSADFSAKNLNGFANWMNVQAQEELTHGMKIYNYINEQGGKVLLTAIEAPQTEWDSPLASFEAAYVHEQHVTTLINNLADIAADERDHATGIFLQWFITEQIEEENTASDIVEKLKMIGDHPQGIFMIDRELGARPAAAPVDSAE